MALPVQDDIISASPLLLLIQIHGVQQVLQQWRLISQQLGQLQRMANQVLGHRCMGMGKPGCTAMDTVMSLKHWNCQLMCTSSMACLSNETQATSPESDHA